MTLSKMAQYAKGWKHPEQRKAEKRDGPPVGTPKSGPKPKDG